MRKYSKVSSDFATPAIDPVLPLRAVYKHHPIVIVIAIVYCSAVVIFMQCVSKLSVVEISRSFAA